MKSETSKVRHLISHLFDESKSVIDIGFGGDKVVPYAKSADLPQPYSCVGSSPVDIPCDITVGVPVEDGTFDIVYSSHLLEDFLDTGKILAEFVRILKSDGTLIIVIPDEQKYRGVCRQTGQPYNTQHQIPEMGLKYLKEKMEAFDNFEIVVESDCEVDYNVVLACKFLSKE